LVLMAFIKANAPEGKVEFVPIKIRKNDGFGIRDGGGASFAACESESGNANSNDDGGAENCRNRNFENNHTSVNFNEGAATADRTSTSGDGEGDGDGVVDVGYNDNHQLQVIESKPSNVTHSTAATQASQKSFDMEAFTAKRMTERLKSESLAEKIERRLHRFLSSLEELSSSFITKCSCDFFQDSTSTVVEPSANIEKQHHQYKHAYSIQRPRGNTASTVSSSSDTAINDNAYGNEERQQQKQHRADLNDGVNPTSTPKREMEEEEVMMARREQPYERMPSGLSVEPSDFSSRCRARDSAEV